jgi:hypothetical protein
MPAITTVIIVSEGKSAHQEYQDLSSVASSFGSAAEASRACMWTYLGTSYSRCTDINRHAASVYANLHGGTSYRPTS